MSEEATTITTESPSRPPNEKIDFKSITINQVKEIIMSVGACADIDSFRVNNNPTYIPYDTEAGRTINHRVTILRGHLDGMLNNSDVLSYISNIPDNTELSKQEIAKQLGLGKGYEFVVERLYWVINKGIDPELVAPGVHEYMKVNNLPDIVTESLNSDTTLLLQFVNLITDPTFKKEFNLDMSPGSKPYSKEIKNKIDLIVNRWITNIKSKNDNTEFLVKVQSTFNNFFNLEQKFWPQVSETLSETSLTIQGSTNSTYFEHRTTNSVGELSNWYPSGYGGSEQNIDSIRRHARTVEKGKYLTGLFNYVDDLYQEFFPELYIKPDVQKLSLEEPYKPWKDAPKESCDQSNGFWDGDGTIGIKSGTVVKSNTAGDIANENSFHFAGPSVRRLNTDIVTMAHEEAHAIYEEIVRKGATRPENYHNTADHAINEGTSVLVELLIADKIIENAERLGFNEKDVEEFKAMKTARMYKLAHQKNGYTEGTYKILHKVYSESAGRINKRNMHQGLLAVRAFLDGLDPKKTAGIKRDSPEYLEALKSGDPKKWAGLFK